MKKETHPETHETTITCTCGHVYHTKSTVKNLRVGICAACHPYFTGEQRFVDTAGRVDKFAKRYGATTERRTKPKVGVAAAVKAATATAAAPVEAAAEAEVSA